MRASLRSLAGRTLGRQRGVVMTYPGLRFGNLLYFALQSVVQSTRRRPVLCLSNPDTQDLASLTALGPLFLEPYRLRWTDERLYPPPSFFQHFGVDFTGAQLRDFVQRYLLPHLPDTPNDPQAVTVNVRRGDYYSAPASRTNYGIDVDAYLRTALARQREIGGEPSAIRVVSDDPRWCQDHLGWLYDYADDVTFSAPGGSALSNFIEVASAQRLVLANSTFSYWAAHVSNALYENNHPSVVVPHVHAWTTHGGLAWQHDPGWSVVTARPVSYQAVVPSGEAGCPES